MAGEVLRKRREDLGLHIGQVAELLKIKVDYLAAIENDSPEKLPASVYTKGYIRCYARYLNVDGESVIQYYTKNLSQPQPSMIMPIAFSRKKRPKMLYIVPAAVAIAALFIIRVYLPQRQTDETKQVLHQDPAGVPVYAVAKSENSVGRNAVIEGNDENSLDITANDRTWILVKFKDGKSEEMLLSPGDSKSWKFSDKALLKIGNAGGIKIHFNGKDMGTPGNPGQVKTLSLPEY